ncbi:MAG TPA: endopeptidase La [Candidatus Kapabacteria bacterium]|nr:endopeptidase La [Candidatus Kapabacteria bacterium]
MAKKKKSEDVLQMFEKENEISVIPKKLSILPLRDVVIYPNMIFPVLIGRQSSIRAVATAMERNKYIFVTAQKSPEVEDPEFEDLYLTGTISKVVQVLRLPNNLIKVLIEGERVASIQSKKTKNDFLEAQIKVNKNLELVNDNEEIARFHTLAKLFEEYIKKETSIPYDTMLAFNNLTEPVQKLYFAAANLKTSINNRQLILEASDLKEHYLQIIRVLKEEIELKEFEGEIHQKVGQTLQKSQKKFIIQEQIRALQNELGSEDEGNPDILQIKELLEKAQLPEKVALHANEELERLRKTSPMSPEFAVNRNYLEWIAKIPWKIATNDNFDINHVKSILDEDHFDLIKPKERILEFIAVLNIIGKLKKQIICFVGPPGVGKTSLAKSIARALGRQFVRFSLGGIRDEAEIRGHRRTYIGALPGKIIQSMKKAGTTNPVILLDEIDKMSSDFRGDPSAALLEVLDPEQNFAFNDHFLEVDYDLSNVLFITTANVKYDIPLPLLDRMEVIELTSYIDIEKLQIAKKHIIPKVKEESGLAQFKIDFADEAVLRIIREYTRESGVRSLEREISSIFRKLIKEIVEEYYLSKHKEKSQVDIDSSEQSEHTLLIKDTNFVKKLKRKKFVINADDVEKYLKSPKFKEKPENLLDKVGVVNGLAWTSVGGDIMSIEVNVMSGREKLTLTGKLGDVMKESAVAALSFIRANAKTLGLDEDFAKGKEIHIHVPEGAIPKDGPSAGITMATALLSALSGKSVRGDVAMTGEITLRGDILPIGGLKEKLLAAKRFGIKIVLIPEGNYSDITELSALIDNQIEVIPISNFLKSITYSFR